MIYITGDTHGTKDFIKLLDDKYKNLTKDDYVIICGDCGVCFDKDSSKIINLYQYLPFSVLFVDGNYENFDLLYSYPIEMWKGGKVHRISENVLHLMRGQVFDIDGTKIFAFGGALSFDKSRRIEGKNWWSKESPNDEEYKEAIDILSLNSNRVDYIISHDCPESWMGAVKQCSKIMYEGYVLSPSNHYLEMIAAQIKFKHLFFGHYHEDNDIDSYATELYQRVIPLHNFKDLPYIDGQSVVGKYSSHKKPNRYNDYKLYILGDDGCTFSENSDGAFFNSRNSRESGIRTNYDTWWTMVAHTLGIKAIFNLSRLNSSLDEILKYSRQLKCIEEDKIILLVMLNSLIDDNEKYIELRDEISRVLPNGEIYEIIVGEERKTVFEKAIKIPSLRKDEMYMKYPNGRGAYRVASVIVEKLLN